jgi:hypothetical protein
MTEACTMVSFIDVFGSIFAHVALQRATSASRVRLSYVELSLVEVNIVLLADSRSIHKFCTCLECLKKKIGCVFNAGYCSPNTILYIDQYTASDLLICMITYLQQSCHHVAVGIPGHFAFDVDTAHSSRFLSADTLVLIASPLNIHQMGLVFAPLKVYTTGQFSIHVLQSI